MSDYSWRIIIQYIDTNISEGLASGPADGYKLYNDKDKDEFIAIAKKQRQNTYTGSIFQHSCCPIPEFSDPRPPSTF